MLCLVFNYVCKRKDLQGITQPSSSPHESVLYLVQPIRSIWPNAYYASTQKQDPLATIPLSQPFWIRSKLTLLTSSLPANSNRLLFRLSNQFKWSLNAQVSSAIVGTIFNPPANSGWNLYCLHYLLSFIFTTNSALKAEFLQHVNQSILALDIPTHVSQETRPNSLAFKVILFADIPHTSFNQDIPQGATKLPAK